MTFGDSAGGVGAETQLGDVEQRVEDRADEVAHVDQFVQEFSAR